ncbi:MAG: ion transporter [Pelagibacteraceae bacterium]|jgi:CBS domain containing-hemolysin-like protein|nr:ion transporter [Pelagibacteraceae bacterium]MDC3146527.1 hemolysin family protein [Alphaproteobacteria bacterium]MDC3149827.1 hemolysin family protein [Alphaproteobacteria bacterium]MDC3173186.1 hemolysin family protein [Alphaproteobacteria bacterium]|tara:strand:- start:331 stop:1158 length:828 start_codon:yes stop_codon:yes gene_type:complete
MKIKKNLAIKLVKELIQDENFKKDIIDLISATSDSSGIAKSEEKKIFNNLLKVHKKTVDDVMVPRGEIIFIDQNINKENIIKIINKEAHSRMPVVKNDLEHCLGMVHIKDLFKKINNKSFNIKSLLREVIYIPSATPVFNLLQKMKKQNIHLAIVMDEFNSVTGLVTIEDLVEEIVGEIEDEHDKDEAPMYRQKNENIIMDAAMLVDDFEREFDVNIPEDLKEDVGTIGGIIFNMAGRIPKKKEKFTINKKLSFTIHKVSTRKILEVVVSGVKSQ